MASAAPTPIFGAYERSFPVLALDHGHPLGPEGADEHVVARQAHEVRAIADRDLVDGLGGGRGGRGRRRRAGGGRGRLRGVSPLRRRRRARARAITPTAAASEQPGHDQRRGAGRAPLEHSCLRLRLKVSFGVLGRGRRRCRRGPRRGGHRGRLDRRRGALGDEPLALGGTPVDRRRDGGAAEVAGRRVALLRVLGQRALDHGVERGRDLGDEVGRLRRRLGQVRPEARLVAVAAERHDAGEREEQQAAERVDVRAGVDALAADLLRRDIVERPDPVAGLGRAGHAQRVLGQPEVGQIDVVLGGQEDIGGLDVAVHQTGRVGLVERRADLGHDPRRPLRVEVALAPHQAAHVVAGDVAHRDVGDPALVTRVVDRDHVRVIDRRRDLRLAHEPGPDRLILQQPGRDHLQRDRAVQRQLRRPVHDAHAAAPRDRLDAVAGED